MSASTNLLTWCRSTFTLILRSIMAELRHAWCPGRAQGTDEGVLAFFIVALLRRAFRVRDHFRSSKCNSLTKLEFDRANLMSWRRRWPTVVPFGRARFGCPAKTSIVDPRWVVAPH